MPDATIAIIGAGLSGLNCARHLALAGHSVTVFEKSRSLAGRCATRRWEGHVVDHGAQYFTARTDTFRHDLETICPGEILPLEAPVIGSDGTEIPATDSARFYHRQGNNRLGPALLASSPTISVHKEHTLQQLEPTISGWRLQFAEGSVAEFSHVILSLPSPQTARLLDLGTIEPNLYAPCLTGFFLLPESWPGRTREVYGRYTEDAHEGLWSACENHKAGRVQTGCTVLVAQASPGWSQRFLETEPSVWLPEMGQLVAQAWGLSPNWAATFGHRWRFARRTQKLSPPALPQGILLTGDSLCRSRVEDVWLMGAQTAQELLASGRI
jgi:predicted NAD/FAD-dependent oxidoreductase